MGEKASRSYLKLEYNKSSDTEVITDDCKSWSFTDNASGKADTMSLTLADNDQRWLHNYYPEADDKIKAWIETEAWFTGGKPGELYLGAFLIDNFDTSGFPHNCEIEGISIPVNKDFSVTEKNKTWKSTTLQEIAKSIAGTAGVGLVYEAGSFSVTEESQSNQTDEAFLFSLCSARGLCMKLYNDKIVIYDMAKYEAQAARYSFDQKDCEDYRVHTAIMAHYDAVQMQYTSGKKAKTYTYNFTVPGTAGARKLIVSGKADSVADAEQKAKAALREKIRQEHTMSITVQGNTEYMAADCCNITGFGKIDGKYFVDSVTHAKSGKYTCSLELHKVVTTF